MSSRELTQMEIGLTAVERYIENQEKHHRKISFEDEFVALLGKHGIPFDRKFVFG